MTKDPALLIVDDDPVFSRFIGQLVQSLAAELPCRVEYADSAETALERISHGWFDLALVDYHLPAGNGLDLLEQIKHLSPPQQPAVIMLTGSGSAAVAVEAMKRGARDYLQKNEVDVPSLMRALQSALSQKRLAEQVAAYNEQMKADLEMAHRLQESLLPQSYPCFPPHVRAQGFGVAVLPPLFLDHATGRGFFQRAGFVRHRGWCAHL